MEVLCYEKNIGERNLQTLTAAEHTLLQLQNLNRSLCQGYTK
jgi:hypothetical protein